MNAKSFESYGIQDKCTLHLRSRWGTVESLLTSLKDAYDNEQMKGIHGAMRSRSEIRGTTLNRKEVGVMYDALLKAQGSRMPSAVYEGGVRQEVNGEALGTTALVRACTEGDALGVAAVYELGNADLDCPTKDGVTPLYAASMNSHVKIVDYLLQNGVELKPMLEKAAKENQLLRILPALLQHRHRSPRNSANLLGTAFKIALETNGVDVVQLLLERGANECTVWTTIWTRQKERKTITGASPLSWAISKDSVDCVKLLINHGARLNGQWVAPTCFAAFWNSHAMAAPG